MSRRSTRVGLVQLIPLTLLFCLVPFCIYYLFYYQSAYSYMIDRNMRSVARVAKLTEERLANFYRVIENSVGVASRVEENELQKSAKTALSYVPDLEYVSLNYKKYIGDKNGQVNAKLDESSAGPSEGPDQIKPEKEKNHLSKEVNQDLKDEEASIDDNRDLQLTNQESFKTISVISIHESKGTKLRLTYRGRPQVSKLQFFNPVTIKADVFLADLVGELDRDGVFDEVAILDDRKNVLLQTDPHGPRLAQFLAHKSAEGVLDDNTSDDVPAAERESATKTLTLGNKAYRIFWQPIQLNLKLEGSRLGSSTNDQSKGKSFTNQNDKYVLWVYGIAKESKLRREALRIEVIPLLVLVFILLMAAAAWPLLKVALLGTRGRLSVFDIRLIKLAIVSGVAIMTIFILGIYCYCNLLIDVDRGLLTLSEKIRDNLRRELKTAVRQLKEASTWEELDCRQGRSLATCPEEVFFRYPSVDIWNSDDCQLRCSYKLKDDYFCVEKKRLDSCETCETNQHETVCYDPILQVCYAPILQQSRFECRSEMRAFQKPCEQGCLCSQLLAINQYERCCRHKDHYFVKNDELMYQGIGMLITANEEGEQLAKWTIKDKNTPKIKISDREYHQKVKRNQYDFDCSTSSADAWCDGNTPSYVVSPIRSNNTGKKLTIVLIKHPASDKVSTRAKTDPLSIQLTTQLESLWEAILPLGYGFAIVDSNGFVLYHSDNRLSLEENIFHEIENPNKLQASIANREHSIITLQYHGEKHRALGTKLGSSSWSLVVFAKTIYFETVILETTLSSLVFFLTVLTVISLIRVAYMLKTGRRHSRWLWYASEKLPLYNRAIKAFGICGLASFLLLLIAVDVLSSSRAFALSILWAFIAIYIAWRILGRNGIEELNQDATLTNGNAKSLASVNCTDKNERREWLYRIYQQWDARKRYLAMLMLFLVFTGVLPTTAFFLAWYNANKRALNHNVERNLEKQRSERMHKLKELYHNVSGADEAFLERRNEKLFVGRPGQTIIDDKKYYPAVYWYSPFGELSTLQADDSQKESNESDRLVASFLMTLPAHNEFALRLREAIKQGVIETLRDPLNFAYDGNMRSIPMALQPLTEILCFFVALLFLLSVCLIVRYVAENILGLGVALLSTDCVEGIVADTRYKLHLNPTKEELVKLIDDRKKDKKNIVFSIDMRRLEVVDRIVEVKTYTHVILHHFESLLIRSDVRTKVLPKVLDLLEELALATHSIEVVVCSQIDPVYYLHERRRDDRIGYGKYDQKRTLLPGKKYSEKEAEALSHEEIMMDDISRCVEVFSQFIRIQHRVVVNRNGDSESSRTCEVQPEYLNDDSTLPSQRNTLYDPPPTEITKSDRPVEDEDEVKRYIESELDWDDELRSLKKDIIATNTNNNKRKLTIEELFQKIAYFAAPRHRFLWTLCTNTEKIVLIDLASEGTINPKNWNVATELVARGLVRWNYGTYFVASRTFERFVLQAMRPDDVTKLRQVTPSAWSWISIPLLVLLITSFAFFFWSQPEFTESVLAILGAGTAGLAGLVKLIAIIKFTPDRDER